MKATPEELWQLALKGNQAAWKELYECFGKGLYQFFLKNTRNSELAMDKVQEVFLKIFRSKESFHYGNLKTWIYRIARNLLIDEWRKSGNKEIPSEMKFDIKDDNIHLEEQVINDLHQNRLVELLDESLLLIPEEERLVIGLVYLGGLAIPELSEVMEIPLGTAKTKVRQARLKLDSVLSEKMKLNNLEK